MANLLIYFVINSLYCVCVWHFPWFAKPGGWIKTDRPGVEVGLAKALHALITANSITAGWPPSLCPYWDTCNDTWRQDGLSARHQPWNYSSGPASEGGTCKSNWCIKVSPPLITGSPRCAESWTSWRSDGGGGRKLKVGSAAESWKLGKVWSAVAGAVCHTRRRAGKLHNLFKTFVKPFHKPKAALSAYVAWFWVTWIGSQL